MRYHFQTMKLVCAVAPDMQTDVEALQELNAHRKQHQQLPYQIFGQIGGRIYLPSNELLSGDQAFFAPLGEDRDYDGVSAYYDSLEESRACFSLLSPSSYAARFYYIVVHAQYALFVRKEEQLIQDVERFIRIALSPHPSSGAYSQGHRVTKE